jgi:hypothetical protein
MRGGLLSVVMLAAMAGCQGSPAPAPAPSASAVSSSVASASAAPIASAAPSSSADANGAKPLSARGKAELDRNMQSRASWAHVVLPEPVRMKSVEDTFLIVAGDATAPLDAAVALVSKLLDVMWRNHFKHRPELVTVVWTFGTRAAYEPFRRLNAPRESRPSDLSMYIPDDSAIFFCPEGSSIGTLNHEALHPLVDADFPHAGYWLLEGLPALGEAVDIGTGSDGKDYFHPLAHFRLQTLRTALTKPEYASQVKLDTLFTLTTRDAFIGGSEALHMAMAREALRFLSFKHALWPFYWAWREGILSDPTGEHAFASAMGGATPASATDEWVSWIKSPEAE